jgi:replicative DNA helicase
VTVSPLASSYVAEIEQEVLGALLHGGDFRKVASFLKPDHFIADLHSILFSAIAKAFEQFGSTSVPIVAKLLPEDCAPAFMERTGQSAMSYMTGLRDHVVFGINALDRSGRAVVSQWARLKTGELGAQLTAAAADPSADAGRIIKTMAADMDTVAAELRIGPNRRTRMSIGHAAENAVAEVEAAIASGSEITGITWGLTDVNRRTGGLHRGEMAILGARPSMGKTAFALSVALNMAKSGAGVGFLSLEMSASRLALRAMTDLAFEWGVKVPYSDMINGRVERSALDQVAVASQDLAKLPLFIEEQDGLTLTDIRVKIDRLHEDAERAGVRLQALVVDYLQLIKPSARYAGNRNGEISEISAGLRSFAKEYGLAVLALSQLSRAVESRPRKDRRPILADLRDSGSIEQDADSVFFLFREAYYLEKEKGADAEEEAERIGRLIDVQNKLEFIIGKQRSGPVGTVDLFVDVACSAVRNAARF